MTPLGRSDSSAIGRWFWTIDRALLVLVLLLVGLGLVLVLASSGPQAHRLDLSRDLALNEFYFFSRQAVFALVGLAAMIVASFLPIVWVRRLGALGFFVCLIGVVLTLFLGDDAKGAQRWLDLGMMELQPSELLKPCFVIMTAWMLSARYDDPNAPAFEVSFILLLAVAVLLVLQPDYGQTVLFLTIWLAQAMLAGLSLVWVGAILGAGLVGLGVAYIFEPHVASRIDRFLAPESGDTYQVDKALEAFRSGGLFGVGPSEGVVKWQIPDAHTDFIFSVAGEELGLLACSVLAILYLAIILRVCKQLLDEEDPFVFLATAGLIVQFGAQAIINMGVNLALLPAKGMTLPFVSYGGSSFLSTAVTVGLILALTRRNRFRRVPRLAAPRGLA
jgi:cell division protein FtsW